MYIILNRQHRYYLETNCIGFLETRLAHGVAFTAFFTNSSGGFTISHNHLANYDNLVPRETKSPAHSAGATHYPELYIRSESFVVSCHHPPPK